VCSTVAEFSVYKRIRTCSLKILLNPRVFAFVTNVSTLMSVQCKVSEKTGAAFLPQNAVRNSKSIQKDVLLYPHVTVSPKSQNNFFISNYLGGGGEDSGKTSTF
jgi:hypothetical protein